MRILTLVTWALGITLIAVLVYLADARVVVGTAAMVGWGFVPVLLVRVAVLYVDSHSWRWLLSPADRFIRSVFRLLQQCQGFLHRFMHHR